MPLKKLWNTLRGRSNQAEAPENLAVTSKPAVKAKSAGRSILGLGGRGPHAALCKLVRPLQVRSVLEISVDQGSRALAVLRTLSANNEEVRYAAIDQFELAGGPVSLKEFHQSLRTENIRPQLFPNTLEQGLIRVASTIGTIDLVLIGADPEIWQTPTVLALLPRVVHSDSTVLYLVDETWSRYELASNLRRAG